MTVIDKIVEEGIQEGVFRNDINPPLVRQMIFGTIDEIVTNWVMKEQKYDLINQASQVHDLIMNGLDRKSTRLNSSHVSISYAVFCLKKKRKIRTKRQHT